MKEKEQGVTMIVLVITVAVLTILTGIVFYQGLDVVNSAKLQSLSTNLLLIQTKAQMYSEQAKFEGNSSKLKGSVVTDTGLLSKLGLTKNDNIRSLSKEDLKQMGLPKIEEDNNFVIDYRNNEIYYTKGYKGPKGNTLYKLTDILNLAERD